MEEGQGICLSLPSASLSLQPTDLSKLSSVLPPLPSLIQFILFSLLLLISLFVHYRVTSLTLKTFRLLYAHPNPLLLLLVFFFSASSTAFISFKVPRYCVALSFFSCPCFSTHSLPPSCVSVTAVSAPL